MKKLVILCLLTYHVFSVKAQAYIPTLSEGNKWDIWRNFGMGSSSEFSYFVRCDTFINNRNYKKAMYANNPKVIGYFREDTLLKKIYKWNKDSETDQIIIDYGLTKGDTFVIRGSQYVVDSTSYKLSYGKLRNHIYFNNYQYFIEGVGYSFSGLLISGYYETILNFEEEKESCPNLVSENVLDKILPNPTSGFLTIYRSNPNSVWVTVFNSVGQVIKKVKTSSFIEMYELATGFYFLQIGNEKKLYKILKI